MDESEDPLNKISHQLSELAAVPNAAGAPSGAPVDHGGQWTQFSGIFPQTGQEPIRNICSWNPMDLPDFKPLSQLSEAISEPSPNHFGVDSEMFSRRSDFLNRSQFSWPQDSFPNQKFQVTGDLAGRLVDVSRNRVHCCSFDQQNHSHVSQGNFQPPSHVFQFNHIGSGSNVPLHRQMSQPSTRNPFVNLDRASRFSQSSASDTGTMSNSEMTENTCPDEVILTRGVVSQALPKRPSVDVIPPAPQIQTLPVFDPCTPPPLFPFEKLSSENFQQKSSSFSNASNDDIVNYLQAQEKRNISLDLGTTINRTSQSHFSSPEHTFASSEGQILYDRANKQWHSFDSGGVTSSENVTPSHCQPLQSKFVEPGGSRESSKPSYSDIAKIPKVGTVFGAKIDHSNIEGNVRSTGSKSMKMNEKSLHGSMKKTSGTKFWPKAALKGEADQPKVSPASRYGLDSFSDQLMRPGSHSSSSESLTHVTRSRRGSGSSAGSSVSAHDDITSQGATGHISFSESNFFDRQSSPVHKQPLQSTNAAQPSSSTKSTVASSQSASKESLFFDPRRIFQCKNTNKYQAQASSAGKLKRTTGAGLDDFRPNSAAGTVLNNDKPATSMSSSKLLNSARQHGYINNDLRDSSKLTNQTAAESSHGPGEKAEVQRKQRETPTGRMSDERTNGTHLHSRRKSPDGSKKVIEAEDQGHYSQPKKNVGFLSDVNRDKLVEWFHLMWEKMNHWGSFFFSALLKLHIFMLGVILFLASGAIHLSLLLISKSWMLIKGKLLRNYFEAQEESSWKSHDHLRKRVGLEENINLPATGDEAMKRLLACKGKDPYSILGLRSDSTDEDIKKYYRKQAVLVHPDKNQEPGAEEAFKILGHAFEMIGESAKRKQYDSHAQETDEAEAMREFAEMLCKLQTKIQEAMNTMHCDNCGGKHRRVPVDRPFYSARFCQGCNTRHSAKEGDVWAESTMLGFYWHYFALMEGHVFDITEWMKCHKEYFSRMEANSHAVNYRITTDGNRRSRHHHQPGDANLEDFINRLLNKSSAAAADGQGSSWGASHPGTENRWGQGGASTTSAAANAAKKNRRKKKRH